MNWNRVKLGLGLALIYWIPATLALFNIMYGGSPLFSAEIDELLMPGYFIGFALGFAGGNSWGIAGQAISLFIFTWLALPLTYFFKAKSPSS
jgi:hypothetical protein